MYGSFKEDAYDKHAKNYPKQIKLPSILTMVYVKKWKSDIWDIYLFYSLVSIFLDCKLLSIGEYIISLLLIHCLSIVVLQICGILSLLRFQL